MKFYIVYFFFVVVYVIWCLKYWIGFIIEGDVVIGGLIFVYFLLNFVFYFGNFFCYGDFYLWGYKGVEVMLYVVEFINNDIVLFFNVIFGVDIKDICGSVDYVIMESLSFDFIRSVYVVFELVDCGEVFVWDKWKILC